RGDLGETAFGIVASLLDKSLLWRGQTHMGSPVEGEPRFGMLETIREYASEELVTLGEAAGTRRSHAEYFLAMAQAADRHLLGAEQAKWLDRLEQDHDNLRGALEWSLE